MLTPRLSRRRFSSIIAQGTLGLAAFSPGCEVLPARSPRMTARVDPASGQVEVADSGRLVLRYNYRLVEPGDILKQVSEGNRKYTVPRSNYIHPLYGLDGAVLTRDWPLEHPHHRGIYWAWPEVDWHGQRGDLHALQKVFARPSGRLVTHSGPNVAEIDAENYWTWEDGTRIVLERAIVRVFSATAEGQALNLRFEFSAMDELVSIARRGTNLYGGLNIRHSPIHEQSFIKHTDPVLVGGRMAWSDAYGVFSGATRPGGMAVFQHPENPDYPGDWVEYPELNWLQPTFPGNGHRFELRRGRTLVLRYRAWIYPGGPLSEAAARQQWTIGARNA